MGLRLSKWFERWFPDAFALALVAVVIVFVACLAIGNSPMQAAQWFGTGFWDLVTFTMQMSMIIITGYAVATAPPVYAVIRDSRAFRERHEAPPRSSALFSMLSSLLSWSFSLIFSALLAREVDAPRARRRLSRDRRGRVSRRRQRLGARPVVVRGADHGGAGLAAALDLSKSAASFRSARRSGSGRACSWPLC